MLSVADSGVLLFFLLIDSIKALFPQIKDTYAYAAFFSWFGYPLFFYFMVYSRWVMIGATVGRYFVMKYPLKIHILYSVSRTYSGLVVMAILAIFPVVPFWFYFKPIQTASGYKLGKTEFGAGNGGLVNEFWIHCIVLVAIPFFTIAVLNVMIIYKVMKQKSTMKGHRGSGRYFNLLKPSYFCAYIIFCDCNNFMRNTFLLNT